MFDIGATKITNWLGPEELIPKDLETKLRVVGGTYSSNPWTNVVVAVAAAIPVRIEGLH